MLQFLVKNIYVNDNSIQHKIVKNAPREICCLLHPIMLQVHFRWTKYNTQPTYDDKQNVDVIHFFQYLKRKMNIHCKLQDVIFVNRKGVRKVLDLKTKKTFGRTTVKSWY